jgi:hypothetical protein
MATKLIPVGAEFQVNQITPRDQVGADVVALSDGRFAVVYGSNINNGDTDVYGQFVNANGTVSGMTLLIEQPTGLQFNPAAAARLDGGFTTVWEDHGRTNGAPVPDPDIFARVVSSVGGIGPATAIATTAFALNNPDITTLADGRHLIVFESKTSDTNHDILFNVLSVLGTTLAPSTAPLIVENSTSFQSNPAVAASGNAALVVYEDAGGLDISARLFNGATNTVGASIPIAHRAQGVSRPDVAHLEGNRFVIAYDGGDDGGLFAKIYDAATGFLSSEILVSLVAGTFERFAKVTETLDGGFIITWSAINNATFDIHERRFDAHGMPFGDEFIVNSFRDDQQLLSVVAAAGANVLTVWEDFGSRGTDLSPAGIRGQAALSTAFDYDSAPYGDVNNNGRADILFQNDNPAAPAALWQTDTSGALSSITSLGALPAGYRIDGTGDFNSTPGGDILIRKVNEIDILVPNGTNPPTFVDLGGNVPNGTLNAGIGDFTGDGQDDLLFQTGNNIASWRILNNQITQIQTLGSTSPDYHIVGIDDFTGDHQADILFRRDNGEIARWQIANNQLVPGGAQTIGTTSPLYHVVGTGDFDGNGANDILFRNDNGDLAVWLLNSSGQLLGAPAALGNAGLQYHVDGTGDLNGDRRSDIIFRDTNGTLVEWLMNGASFAAPPSVLGTATVDYSIAAHHFDLI